VTPDIPDHQARILIVDDERQNRDVLEIMLAPEGFVLLSAASGEEALDVVARQPPDLILLDVLMPGMDDRQARILGLRAGAEDFLSKPVDRVELCKRGRRGGSLRKP
jgi:CheY-like chemotaxis protein